MTPSGSQWHQWLPMAPVAPNDTQWHPVSPTQWHPVAPGGPQWHPMACNGTRWHSVARGVTQCHPMSPHHGAPQRTVWSPKSQCHPMSPTVTQCHPMALPKDPHGTRGHGVTQCHLISPTHGAPQGPTWCLRPWCHPLSPDVTRCLPIALPKDPHGTRGHGVTQCHPLSPGVTP